MNVAVQDIVISQARLPQTYENAKTALSNCASIDECQDWADKAAALASYAKMAEDDELMNMALRIRSRAIRRAGELLKQIEPAPNQHVAGAGAHTSRADAARDAGMSKHQQVQAIRVANVPLPVFERQVEGAKPPTITALAQQGKKEMPTPPPGFSKATQALGAVEDFAEFCRTHDPLFVAGGVLPFEAAQARENVAVVDAWLDRFVINLKG